MGVLYLVPALVLGFCMWAYVSCGVDGVWGGVSVFGRFPFLFVIPSPSSKKIIEKHKKESEGTIKKGIYEVYTPYKKGGASKT